MKRIVFTVSTAEIFKKGRIWFIDRDQHALPVDFQTRAEAVAIGREMALLVAELGGTSQLRVKGMDGKFKFERTYPRSSDPRSRKS